MIISKAKRAREIKKKNEMKLKLNTRKLQKKKQLAISIIWLKPQSNLKLSRAEKINFEAPILKHPQLTRQLLCPPQLKHRRIKR